MNKAGRLAALKTEKPEAVHAVRQERIRVYEETAVHRFIDGNEWVLEVWARQNGATQVNIANP